ncbi:hypothetical protein LSH36_55g07058 [Paralvinella palmiformis]|uniref:E3 ubiquitin-protein ligase CHFR n=1 Tax=Paralvinella palmiformis TaxID=53620 RepID=A0AAD9K519_9ANNE|nr:hypothetical protein LSH36_55g07058 [Paralvinella palmiformis]
METLPQAWAQLVSTSENQSEPVEIKKNKFVIGRSTDAELSLTGNKLISGRHCFIERCDNGEVWLHDTSTNGTLLNETKKLLKTVNVAYVFQDMEALISEEMNSLSEQTIDYDVEDNDTSVDNSNIAEPQVDSTVSKKRKAESSESDKCEQRNKHQKTEAGGMSLQTKNREENGKKGDRLSSEENAFSFEQSLTCIICQEIFHDCISCQPCMHCFCAGCYSDWMTKSSECPSVKVLEPKKAFSDILDEDESVHDDLSTSSEENSDLTLFGFPKVLCRQCPEYKTSTIGCPLQITKFTSQVGVYCYRMYCHLYWGCQADGCDGCLAKFKDLHFGPKCLRGLILMNDYESDIFKVV